MSMSEVQWTRMVVTVLQASGTYLFLYALLNVSRDRVCTSTPLVLLLLSTSDLLNYIMSTQARKQAPRLARPAARYWKGKAPKGVVDADSDSDVEEAPQMEEEGDVPISGDQDIVEEEDEEESIRLRTEAPKSMKMNVTLKDVNISKDGKVIVAGRVESGRTALEEDGAFVLLRMRLVSLD